jgi:hypothetical protein
VAEKVSHRIERQIKFIEKQNSIIMHVSRELDDYCNGQQQNVKRKSAAEK